MAYRFRRKADVGSELQRIVAEQVERIVSRLTDRDHDTAEDREEKVHEARQRLKKIRAALRLARPTAGEAWFELENDTYRDIGRRLAPARDADVLIRTFDGLVAKHRRQLTGAGFAQARRAVVACRDAVIGESGAASDTTFDALAGELREARSRIADWRFEAQGFELIEPGLVMVYRRGRRAMKQAFAQPSDQAFHDWRKRVKDGVHHMRLLRNVYPAMVQAQRNGFDELADLLGEDHDLAVLRGTLEQRPTLFASPTARLKLMQAIDQRRRKLLKRARHAGLMLYAERPRTMGERLASYWKAWHACRAGVALEAIKPDPGAAVQCPSPGGGPDSP